MREILMINDKLSNWLPAIENSASQHDFNVTTAPSVEEGLEKLRDFPDRIKAVIIGLSFAEGKMQGIEGILRIKEIDKCIPIIMLSSKTDNLQLISECKRIGAHEYFVKPNINTGLLFLQIESAIEQSNLLKKPSNFARLSSGINEIKPAFYLNAENERPLKGYFAYRLNAVACASYDNKPETEYLCQMAYEWHYNFLNTLTFYNSDLTIRLRYINNPGSEFIDSLLVFEFNVQSNEQAAFEFEEICDEFDSLMQLKKDFGKTTYYFSPVTDEIDLRNILCPFFTDNLIQFTPEFTEYDNLFTKSIGFSNVSNEREGKMVTPPSFLKPEIKLDRFCEQLFHQKTRTMVEIVMSPVQLEKHETDYLRELLSRINSYNFTDIEKAKASQIINEYLKTPSKCFNVEVFEAQESKSIGKNLLSAISAAFFESATHVNAVSANIREGNILKKEDEVTERRNWNYLYTLSNIINVFKFPYPFSTEIPGIRSFRPIYGYLPENVSKTGVVAGIKNNGGIDIPIKINIEDLRQHLYMLGQTGTGKTTVLYTMVMDMIMASKGVCVIDPHGDLQKKILENLPENRIKDVIRFEPGSPENTIRINLLEYNKENPQEKSFLIDDLFNFFRQEYDVHQTMGPMFELFMKNSLLLLMDDADNLGSIGDITSVFQNTEFRNNLLSKCQDSEVVDFWRETAVKLSGDYTLVNFTPYIVSKLNQLLINEFIKPIVVTPKSNIDFREIIDNNKILLVSLSKGRIGKIGVNILGTIVLSRIINAALSRENIPENNRKDFTLFVDEFQNFVSQSIIHAMSEARKYRLSLVLANQTLGQLNDTIKQSVLGNVGSTIFFRPGINDVDYIMPYFTPYLTRENVLTLPNFRCIGRFQIDNALSIPFIFDTIPPKAI